MKKLGMKTKKNTTLLFSQNKIVYSSHYILGLDTALRTAVITAIRTDFYGPYVSVRAVLWKAVKIRKNI